MEKWQNKLIVDVFNVSFKADAEKVKEAFRFLCKPLNDYQGINFNDKYCLLEVGNVFYRLGIASNEINIIKNDDKGIMTSVSYIVDSDNNYTYKNLNLDKIYDTGKLESIDFDYKTILNKLMDILIVQA